MERYFSINAVIEDEKMEAAVVCLEGKALSWYQWIELRNSVNTWTTFKRQVLGQFQHSQAGDAYEVLMALLQDKMISVYREKFEALPAPLIKASDEMLMGVFRNGLKEDIRAELRIMRFGLLQEMMDLAHKVEERNMVVEHNREDFLSKHLKTAAATKWTVTRPGYRAG